jgi:hypothetical protein
MRHFFLTSICLSMLLNACATTPPGGTRTPQVQGIPTFETPEGILPGKAEASPRPSPTMKPVRGTPSQEIDTPDLGVHMTIPIEWSSQVGEGVTTIVDGDGTPMLVIGQAYGFSADTDLMINEMNQYLLKNGFRGGSFTIRQDVVNLYGYVVVKGRGIDACQYVYLPVGLSAVAFKFERALCETDGDLNDTAFAILHSVRYEGPIN